MMGGIFKGLNCQTRSECSKAVQKLYTDVQTVKLSERCENRVDYLSNFSDQLTQLHLGTCG